MSRPTDDADARPPRKSRRPANQDDPSVFVPNSKPGAAAGRPNPNPAAGTKRRAADGLPADVHPGRGPSWYERIFFGRVSSGQLAMFCRQFSAYMNAGVDIGKALANLQRQFGMTALGSVIGRLALAVKRGDSFAEAVAREPQAFDPLFVGMMKVAEARGGIPETLRSLGEHYEYRQGLIRQARSAMIYPIAVLIIASGVAALMAIYILPMFAGLLRDVAGRSASLPVPSRMLLAFSDFVRSSGWFVIPAVMIGTPMFLIWFSRTPGGKPVMDQVLMRLPVFGKLLRKLDTTRFARTLSTLTAAGVDIGSSLDLVADVVRLDPFRRAVKTTKSMVLNGSELSVAMDATGRFGPDVIAVVNSGEETGKLPESLDHLADDYEEQVAYMVKNMGQLVQPILMVMMGALVLFLILAVFLPYISVITSLSGAAAGP